VDRVVLNAMLIKRGEAALFRMTSSPPSRLYSVVAGVGDPGNLRREGIHAAGISDLGDSSRERANARVNYSADDGSNSYQSDIPLQKCDQKKSSDGDTDSGPVN
jgi:hypothetical protein